MYIPSEKDITFGDDARHKLASGVRKLTEAVEVTMGPRGRNVLLQKELQADVLTKDGVSVAQEIELKDTLENMGAQLVKEVSRNTAQEAGDGTTTATVLANAIFQEGLRNITSGANPIEVKRGMDKILIQVIKELKENSKEIQDKKEIQQVATISANGDNVIGDLIAEAMDRVGKDGVITVEEASGLEDSLEVKEGMVVQGGHLSPYFITDTTAMTTELTDPVVLVTSESILELKSIMGLLEYIQEAKKPLLIITPDISAGALNSLVSNKVQGIIDVTVIKAPGFGDTQKNYLDDIGILTGATVASGTNKVEEFQAKDLGTASKITVFSDETIIQNKSADIEGRVAQIKGQIENSKNEYEGIILKDRLQKLAGGIAIIKVGASTQTEMKEKKDRIDDALGATKAAVEEGIIIGGGAALLKVKVVNDLENDQKIGADIVLRALKAPISQITKNAGYDAGVVINKVLNSNSDVGFNAATGEYTDMFKDGIIDSFKVARVALSNAVSVSSMLLTTEAIVSIAPKEK